ncbi:MAG: efflux RND transporter permease subunit, partial [Candidatus Rokuibacteriota bacterium]
MQKLADVCIRRPVFAAMLVLSLVVVGAASYARLGVDRFPSVDVPTVSIRTELSGASAEEVETQVTREIEQFVNTVQGIREMRSISGPSQSIVLVEFDLRRNIDVAAQDVREKVAMAIRNLPRDAKAPIIAKFDNDQAPVLTVAVAGDRPLRELTELADKVVKVQLERSFGVGEVRLVGGLNRAINIWVEADRLAAYQLPITAVREALVRQNADMPGGNVTAGLRESSLRTLGRVADPRAFDDVVIATVNGAAIRVRDVGRAEDGTAEQRSVARLNGVPSVILEVRRQSGENTVSVIDSAKASLARLAGQIPADVRLEVIRDQSRYIHAALREIRIHLILGSILASLVVLAFMRSWQSTIIAAVAIPASVISAFGMMWALGFTLNSVTMLALVLMVGIVIDDAIVVLENVFRFVEEKRMTPFAAAKAATADIGLAVMATTFSLVVIFLPVSFMSSVSGRFLYQFGVTAAVSVLVSLLVSFTLTPMMSARMIRTGGAGGSGGSGDGHGHAAAASRRGFYAWLDRGYAWTLQLSMRHRWVVVAVSLATIAATWPIYGWVKQEYTPTDVDESEFEASINGPEGISMPAMDEAVQAIGSEIRGVPGVRNVLITAGGGFLGRISQGNVYVRTAPHDERTFGLARLWRETLRGAPLAAFRGNYTQREVMQQVRQRLRKFRDFRILVRNIPGFNIGG